MLAVGSIPLAIAAAEKQPTAAELRKERREAEKAAEQALRKARRSGDEKAIADAKAALALAKKKARGKGADMAAEFAALMQAAALLEGVNDEQTAAKAAQKMQDMFKNLPAPNDASDDDIERWATEQNKLNMQMERLRSQPWFESAGLQEAWTTATDPYSRTRYRRKK